MTVEPHHPDPEADWWERVSTSALLRAAFRSYGDVVRAAVADAGFDDLPRNGAYVVGATAKGALTMQQLPSALGVTKQAFSQLVDSLVLRGYVERAADPDDRRRLRLTLTGRGREVATLVDECGRRSDDALLTLVEDPAMIATTKRVLGAMTAIPVDLGVGPVTAAVVTPTVDDAVRSHISWMTALTGLANGTTWTDGPLRWAYDGPYGTLHALFPDDVPVDAARRGLERARSMDAAHVAIWSATDVERPELEEAGFEVGWQPWWMGRPTAGIDEAPLRLARRAVLSARARPSEQVRQPLLERDDVFRVEARADGRYAGRAWGHVHDGAAGLYDMVIREPFRRRGLGTEVVASVVAHARRCGADRVTLNATPDGERLYASCGFTLLGRGRTWWWHAPRSALR